MANTKQANKRNAQSERRRVVNKNNISAYRTARKKFAEEPSKESLSLLQKKVDQTCAKGLISKGKASRIIQRANKSLKEQ